MKAELYASHRILAGCCQTLCADFMELFEAARPGDFFYLDPPYQGTSEGRDGRYIEGVSRERILEGVTMLHEKGIPFLLSYDGASGDKTYGDRLPSCVGSRILLEVGRSSQATLNGKNDLTVESLYVSHHLMAETQDNVSLALQDFEDQRTFTFA